MITCTHCNADNPDGTKFCKKCGAGFAKADACTNCGANLSPGAKFCKKCGTHTAASTAAPAPVPALTPESLAAEQETPAEAQSDTPPPATAPETTAEAPVTQYPASTSAPQPADEAAPHHEPERETASLPPAVAAQATGGKQLKMIIAGVVTVAVIAGGLFWWKSTRQHDVPAETAAASAESADSNANAPVTPPALPAAPLAQQPEPTPAPAPEPAPAPVAVPAPLPPEEVEKPAPPIAPFKAAKTQEAKEKPAAKPASQGETDGQMSATANTLLKKADGYLSTNQYEKAIATAESVLAIDPNNRAAKALAAKARARQMDALKSNSSLE